MKRLIFLLVSLILTSGCAKLVFVSERDGHAQIYKMRINGNSQENISNNTFQDRFPDVSFDGKKIVFSSSRGDGENIHIMDINGGNVQQVTSGNLQRTKPRWLPQSLIAFAYPSYSGNAKIWTINSDGTDLHQVTNPGPNESDDGGHDFYDGGKMIVFSRNGDLYSVYYDGSQDFQRITNTTTISETLPIVSHSGKLLAYRTSYQLAATGTIDGIQIVNVFTWTPVQSIIMQPPVVMGTISGIAFSRKDDVLYVSARSSDVPGNVDRDKSEIFSIKLDGTGQQRLTINEVPDYWPSTIPLTLW